MLSFAGTSGGETKCNSASAFAFHAISLVSYPPAQKRPLCSTTTAQRSPRVQAFSYINVVNQLKTQPRFDYFLVRVIFLCILYLVYILHPKFYPRTTLVLPRSSNSDPGSHSGPFPPLRTTVCAFVFIARRILHFSSLVDSRRIGRD